MLVFSLWALCYFSFGRSPTLASYLSASFCTWPSWSSWPMSSLFKWWQAPRECSFANTEKIVNSQGRHNRPTWTFVESLELVALSQNWHVQPRLQESHQNHSAYLRAVSGKGTADCELRKNEGGSIWDLGTGMQTPGSLQTGAPINIHCHSNP